VITILLIVLLILALGGGGFRIWSGAGQALDLVGVLLLVIVVLLIFGLIAPWFFFTRPI
jgi:hypothetical protein